jgi:hypothetical protein
MFSKQWPVSLLDMNWVVIHKQVLVYLASNFREKLQKFHRLPATLAFFDAVKSQFEYADTSATGGYQMIVSSTAWSASLLFAFDSERLPIRQRALY